MAAGVFVLRDDQTLVAMQAAHFASEDVFQDLLGRFPELLAGEQIDVATPRRFLLVDREQSIGTQDGGARRWSLDHLFLDQDGVPTLVEVKRQTDTRIRREVVGQMLDYAANCDSFWSAETLKGQYRLRCQQDGVDAELTLAAHLADGEDPEAFWAKVKTNLQAGKLRLLFVADRIPQELRRIIEFLNVQMQPAEVLGIELRQYEGEGMKALSPVVIGQTQAAQQRKAPTASGARWDAQRIIEAIAARGEPNAAQAAREIIAWMTDHADRVQVTANGAIGPVYRVGAINIFPFLIDAAGTLTLYFSLLAGTPVFEALTERDAWREQINRAPGLQLPSDALVKQPRLALADFAPATTAAFLEAMAWFQERLRQG